jgi:hypothetical protein
MTIRVFEGRRRLICEWKLENLVSQFLSGHSSFLETMLASAQIPNKRYFKFSFAWSIKALFDSYEISARSPILGGY